MMLRIFLTLLVLTLSACNTFDRSDTKQGNDELSFSSDDPSTLEASELRNSNALASSKAVFADDARSSQTSERSNSQKRRSPRQKAQDSSLTKSYSLEEKLDRIDRQAGHPDTNESPELFLGYQDANEFVFSPLFEDIAPPPIPPLNADFDQAQNFNLSNLLPEPNKPKDFSAYGFFTATEVLGEKVNHDVKQHRESEANKSNSDLIVRIRSQFSLDLSIDNKRIQNQLNWYLRNPSYLDRTIRRSSRYIYHVVSQIEKNKLPMELALLPFVESAYDPFAYSHGRASGLWQFIPGTGKIYGLHQNWWYDGRRDVLASTQAAVEYLQYLGKRFNGDWLHALAAYNSGSGRVSGAIRKNKKKGKQTDFWSLKLPRETRAYVPKLIALAKIFKDPDKYGVTLPQIENRPYFSVVKTGGQIDLAQAASLAEVDINEIYKLNPGFNQWASAPLGPHRLLVPTEKAELFESRLKDLPADKRLNWTRYTVKSGDSLIKIAKKFNTTPALVKEVNNLRSDLIRQKQKLLIPVASRGKSYYDLSQTNRLESKQKRLKGSKDSAKITHTVKAGDTMWDLARKHKVGVRSLAKWNGMAPTDPIKPGQKLLIWSRNNTQQIAKSDAPNFRQKRSMIKKIGYRVRKGDSLARIASKFSVSVNDLVSWNRLNRKKYLQPGQRLTIFVDITNS